MQPSNTLKRIGKILLVVLGFYLVIRAAAEPFLIDASKPETYRQDWGGPTYIGAIAVHMLPGIVSLIALVLYFRNLRRHAKHKS